MLLESKPAFAIEQCTAQEAIKHLEQQNQFQISYNASAFDLTRELIFPKGLTQLKEYLDLIFDFRAKYFETRNRKILVTTFERPQLISGFVSSASSGEKLPNVLVYVKEDDSAQVLTNDQGYFTLKTSVIDSVDLIVKYLGFKSFIKTIRHPRSNLKIELDNDNLIPDIIITSQQTSSNSSQVLPVFVEEASLFPSLLGEKDIINSLRKYPEITSGAEAQNGLIVRGGNTDQNLILVDGIPIYEISHLGGLSSILVNDEIKSTEFYASGFPAKYGGRISSVVDISLKEGNKKSQNGNIQASLLGLKGNLEGPLIDSTTSYSISGRLSWFDRYLSPIIVDNTSLEDADLNYFDIHGKLTHHFSENHKLSFSAYQGRDEIQVSQFESDPNSLDFNSINELQWGNEFLNLQWQFGLGSKLFIKNQAYRNKYELLSRGRNIFDAINDNQLVEDLEFDAITSTKIVDNSLNSIIEYYHSNELKFEFGLSYTHHDYEPNIVQSRFILPETTLIDTLSAGRLKANEFASFIQLNSRINNRLNLDFGLRLSYFENEVRYINLEPRLNINYLFSDQINLSFSASRITQNVHLLTSPGTGLPSQLWVPSSSIIRPEILDELSIGFEYIPSKKLNIQLNAYLRLIDNVLDFESSVDLFAQVVNDFVILAPFTGNDWESRVVQGNGRSRGIESLINFYGEKIEFWSAFTLARSEIQFPNIREGEYFPSQNDYRYDLNLGAKVKLLEKLSLSLHWVYNEGRRFTLSTQTRPGSNGGNILVDPIRNRNIFPAFHHLDLNLTYSTNWKENHLVVSLGVHNIYNRANPFYFFLLIDADQKIRANQLSLFPRLPQLSLTYSF